jgi:hypothetical protein
MILKSGHPFSGQITRKQMMEPGSSLIDGL